MFGFVSSTNIPLFFPKMTLMSSTVPVGALLIFPLVRYIVELSRNLTKLTESSKVSKMEMVAKLSCSCQVIVKHYKRTSFSLLVFFFKKKPYETKSHFESYVQCIASLFNCNINNS